MANRRQILLVVAAMFCFSLMAVFSRFADAPILTIAAWRAIVVAVVFGVWAFAKEGPSAFRPTPQVLRLGSVYGLALALASSTFVGGYAFTTVANTIFLHNLAPAITLPLAWWAFKERPSGTTITGAGIAMFGVALLSGVTLFHAAHFTNPSFLLGDFLAFLSAVGYGAVLVITRATRQAETPILSTLFVAWVAASVVLVAIALFAGTMAISTQAMLWVVGLAVISTNIPFYLLNLGMKGVRAGAASVLSMSEVVFASIIGLLLFGEQLAPIGWFGGVLVVAGVLYPFMDQQGSATTDHPVMSATDLKQRSLRGLVWLAVINACAVLAVLEGSVGATLLAWVALVQLLRLGIAPLAAALDYRFLGGIRWGVSAVGFALALGLVLRSREGHEGLPEVMVLALLILGADRWFAQRESTHSRDPLVTGQLVVLLLLVGELAAWVGHPAGQWLFMGAGAVALVQVATMVIAAIAKAPITSSRVDEAGLIRSDVVSAKMMRPGRLAGAFVLLFALGGATIIEPGHTGVVMRWGAPQSQGLSPGLSFALPPPIDVVQPIHTELERRVALEPTPILSGDQSMVTLQASVHYNISDPVAYVVRARDVERLLRRAAHAGLMQSAAGWSIDAILTDGREALGQATHQALQQGLGDLDLGIEVTTVAITKVAVPSQVSEAFLDVISADEERRTIINRAEAYAAKVLPEASGTAKGLLEQAHGSSATMLSHARSQEVIMDAVAPSFNRQPGIVGWGKRAEALREQLAQRPWVLTMGDVEVELNDQTQGTRP